MVSEKMKIFKNIERRITTVPHAEYLKKSDVTLGDKRRLGCITILNFLFFMGQMFVIAITAKYNDIDYTIFELNRKSPITLNPTFIIIKWTLIFVLQFLFVVLSLPFMNPGQHYQNIILLKVKYAFVFQCFLQGLSLILFTSYSYFSKYFFTFVSFFILKSKSLQILNKIFYSLHPLFWL